MLALPRVAILLVVLSVVLAGCVGDSPPNTTPSTPTTDSPPATTATTSTQPTTVATTPGTGDRPPGIGETRIVDFGALRAAHEDGLLSDGGVLRFSSRLVHPDGTLDQASDLTYRFGPGASHVTISGVEHTTAETLSTIDLYLNDSTQTLRRDRDGTIGYAVRPRTMAPETLVWANLPWYIEQFVDTLTVNHSTSGTDRVVLDATMDQFRDVPGNETSVVMVVSENGVVERFEHRQAYPGEEATYIRFFEVTQVGAVSVSPPQWLAEVPPSASLVVDLFSSITDEGALQLEHVGGGDPVPPGTVVQLEVDGAIREATVPTAISSGESLYVFLDQSGALQVREIHPRPGEVEPLPSEFTVRVVTTDGVTLFEESLGWRPPQEQPQ